MCIEWFEYDGRRNNFIMELENEHFSCPCTLDQARADFGRFTAKYDCDENGNSYCYYAQGSTHCVVSTRAMYVSFLFCGKVNATVSNGVDSGFHHFFTVNHFMISIPDYKGKTFSATGGAQQCCYDPKDG